jgi:sugar-specific transcriptional regulator TrmB
MVKLSKTQDEILKRLREGWNVKRIAEARGVSLNSVYEIIHRLEARELVEKKYRPNFVTK